MIACRTIFLRGFPEKRKEKEENKQRKRVVLPSDTRVSSVDAIHNSRQLRKRQGMIVSDVFQPKAKKHKVENILLPIYKQGDICSSYTVLEIC